MNPHSILKTFLEKARPTSTRKGNNFLTFCRGMLGFISLEYALYPFFSPVSSKTFILGSKLLFLFLFFNYPKDVFVCSHLFIFECGYVYLSMPMGSCLCMESPDVSI